MRKLFIFAAMATTVSFSMPAFSDDDRVEHYKGEPSKSLEEAVSNFSIYNHKLEQVLAGELTPEAMADVHKLTYTLENALGKINEEFADVADTLEEIHQASEHADPEGVKSNGKAYLDTARTVIR